MTTRYSPSNAAKILANGGTLNRDEMPYSLRLVLLNLECIKSYTTAAIKQIKEEMKNEAET